MVRILFHPSIDVPLILIQRGRTIAHSNFPFTHPFTEFTPSFQNQECLPREKKEGFFSSVPEIHSHSLSRVDKTYQRHSKRHSPDISLFLFYFINNNKNKNDDKSNKASVNILFVLLCSSAIPLIANASRLTRRTMIHNVIGGVKY